jgi:hypothetical protein
MPAKAEFLFDCCALVAGMLLNGLLHLVCHKCFTCWPRGDWLAVKLAPSVSREHPADYTGRFIGCTVSREKLQNTLPLCIILLTHRIPSGIIRLQ